MEQSHDTRQDMRKPLEDSLAALVTAWKSGNRQPDDEENNPELIANAFTELFRAMERTEAGLESDRANREEISEVGEYAMALFAQALYWAEKLNMLDTYRAIQKQTISMAAWVAAHHGQLFTLEPVVDAFAQQANHTHDPGELLNLCNIMGNVINATATTIQQDLERINPGRPWRVLNLNHAIVATRTHQPDVMEKAFAVLTSNLPEDAPAFFEQGMEQMDLQNYPDHVREVIQRYHRKWSVNRSLH